MFSLFKSINSTGLENICRRSLPSLSNGKHLGLVPFLAPKALPFIRSAVPMALIATTHAPQSNNPLSIGRREYDSEIKDMASYVHNYKIKSTLAVNTIPAIAV